MRTTKGRQIVLKFIVISTIILLALIAMTTMIAVNSGSDEGFDRAMLSFRFDDGYASQIRAYNILKERNMTAVFFCIAGSIGTQDYMGWDQLAEIQADGFEIGSHSMTHRNMLLLSPKESTDELIKSKEAFEAKGIKADSFAYPYGIGNPFIKKSLRENYACAAGYPAFSGVFNRRDADRYSLSCKTDVRSVEDFEANLKKAIKEKTWMVACFHRIDDSGGKYSVSEQELRKMADVAKDYADRGLIKVAGFSEACGSLVS